MAHDCYCTLCCLPGWGSLAPTLRERAMRPRIDGAGAESTIIARGGEKIKGVGVVLPQI